MTRCFLFFLSLSRLLLMHACTMQIADNPNRWKKTIRSELHAENRTPPNITMLSYGETTNSKCSSTACCEAVAGARIVFGGALVVVVSAVKLWRPCFYCPRIKSAILFSSNKTYAYCVSRSLCVRVFSNDLFTGRSRERWLHFWNCIYACRRRKKTNINHKQARDVGEKRHLLWYNCGAAGRGIAFWGDGEKKNRNNYILQILSVFTW